mmetsp:Transcript_98746/g.226904  ORF Transcript_98746/g.226904 Transcript_98746/m.226904 type:complete len:524 (+) Transcript_98746:47-1618(+)
MEPGPDFAEMSTALFEGCCLADSRCRQLLDLHTCQASHAKRFSAKCGGSTSPVPEADVESRAASKLFYTILKQFGPAKVPGQACCCDAESTGSKRRKKDKDDVSVVVHDPSGILVPMRLSELSEKVVRLVPDSSSIGCIVSSLSVDVISLVSRDHLLACSEAGLLLCRLCGRFFSGETALWWHVKLGHGLTHDQSKAHALEAAQIATSFARAPVASVRLRGDDLQAGLAAARAGDSSLMAQLELSGKVAPLCPVLSAARAGDLSKLRCLQQDGMDLTIVDRNGSNALLWAAGGGHLEVVRFLLEAAVDPRLAVQSGRRGFAGRTALHWAARNGCLEVARLLVVESGCHKDQGTTDGTTALHWAAWQGQLDMIRWLASEEGGACSVRRKNSYGCDAAMWCCQGVGGVACCELLRSLGLDFTATNSNNHSVLHKAAQRGNWPIVRWILARCSQREEFTGLGNMGSVEPGWLSAAALFGKDSEGLRPSQLAASEGHHELSTWLAQLERQLLGDCASRCELLGTVSN